MKRVAGVFLACLLVACSDPKEIVLGPEPLKTIEANSSAVKKLSEDDRKLLVGYLMAHALMTSMAGQEKVQPVAGLTIGETLDRAREWKAKREARAEEARQRQLEAQKLQERIDAEKKQIADRISALVTVAVTSKKILPQDFRSRRYDDQLLINYAVENKGDKDIRLLKGTIVFFDATKDKLGDLPIAFDEPISAGKTIKTDTGRVWKISRFGMDDIQRIAHAQFDGMTAQFVPESIAFADGEIIKAPE